MTLRGRFRHWLETRLPRSDSWQLSQRNLYILPTRAGWGFALTLVVMLLASINYQLNLGYALTFLLGGAAVVSMHQTHGNLRRLVLRLRPPQPVFAGDAATLEIVIDNPGRERHGVGLGLYAVSHGALAAAHEGDRGLAHVDVPALGSTLARLQVAAPRRGRQALPTLRIETHFPLGLFRAWSVWRPAAELLVYPAPEHPAPPLPAGEPAGEGSRPLPAHAGGGEFDGVRPWRRGDSLRQVVWKKVARTGTLVSRDTRSSATQALVLDWQRCGAGGSTTGASTSDPEGRLSRLAAWVLAAEQQGLPYALRLPGVDLPRATGDAQRQTALEALAQWQPSPARTGPA